MGIFTLKPTRLTLATLVLGLTLSACATAPPVPEENFYRLPAATPTEALQTPLLNGTLAIGTIDSPGVYRERALLHTTEQQQTKLNRYHYHSWVDGPPRLLQDHITHLLRKAAIAKLVVQESTSNNWQYRLTGKLRRFERVIGDSGSRVVIAVEFQLQQQRHREPLMVRDYSLSVKAPGESINDTVTAFGEGLNKIYNRLINDLQLTR